MLLSEDTLGDYLCTRTDLFDPSQPIAVKRLETGDDRYIDGYLNYLYSVKQGERSFVVKHAREDIPIDLGLGPLDTRRNYIEYNSYRLREGITPQWVPHAYLADADNHFFVTEDLAPMRTLRFELCKGKQFPLMGRQVGQFLAKNHYATSAFCLPGRDLDTLDGFFFNQQMHSIITDLILSPELGTTPADPYEAAIQQTIETMFADEAIRSEWQGLIAAFLEKKQCLIHGDFHTSNAFISRSDLKVIDMEYTSFGPFGYDLGYFLANILSQWAAFTIRGSNPSMCEYLLRMLTDVYQEYFAGLSGLIGRRCRPHMLTEVLQDSLGYLALAGISRIAHHGEFPDYDYLGDPELSFLAKTLSLLVCKTLLTKRHTITHPAQVIRLLQLVRDGFVAEIHER